MEREPIQPASMPVELAGGKTYSINRSNIMPDENGENLRPNTENISASANADKRSPDFLRSERGKKLKALLRDESLPNDIRGYVQDALLDLMPPMAGASPDDPNPEEPITARAGANEPNADRFTPEEQEQLRLFNEENLGEEQEDGEEELGEADRRARAREADRIAEERGKQKILEILIDPSKRNDYFNQIYAQVDARPYDFWDTAFDQIHDGAEEYFFNQIIQNGAQGNWDDVYPTARGYELSSVPRAREIQEALNEWNRENNHNKTLDEIRRDLRDDFERFQKERQVRRNLHNVNAILYLPTVKADQLFENMQQFDSASGDLALAMPGVRDMMNIYESVLREIMAENGGFLPDELVRGKPSSVISGGKSKNIVSGAEADRRTKERFRKLFDAGLITTRAKSSNGDGVWEAQMTGTLEDYELDRIFTLARGMMIMEERLISIAAESRYPRTEDGKIDTVRFASAFLQDVIGATATNQHLFAKWGITEEALGAYLFEGKHDETIARYFKGWNPDTLKKLVEKYQNDQEALFDDLNSTFYLGRRNPNRAGDIYTWVSWRASKNPDARSMLQDYLRNGQNRMADRLADPAIRAEFERNFDQLREAWERSNPGKDAPNNLEDLLKNEYLSWTGTGYRFETLRKELDALSETAEGRRGFIRHDHEAKALIGRMVDLQPQRLYLVSRWIKDRVDSNLTDAQKSTLKEDLENLSMVEAAFLNSREELLNRGKTFDTVTVEDMDEFYEAAISEKRGQDGNIIETKEERIARAKELAAKVRQDFQDNAGEYWKEFVFNRENTHGYALWSGDTPADEYNFSALGATGGFVRRARDNMNQVKATELEIAMLDNLKNMNHPDQVIAALFGIFQPIDHYERGKGQKAMAEKAEGLIRFFKASWKTDLPIAGLAFYKGRRGSSFARMMYGPHAMAWEASDIRYFVERMEHAKMITEEDAHKLLKYTGGEKKHIAYEVGTGLSQLFAIAMALASAELIVKEGFKNDDMA